MPRTFLYAKKLASLLMLSRMFDSTPLKYSTFPLCSNENVVSVAALESEKFAFHGDYGIDEVFTRFSHTQSKDD